MKRLYKQSQSSKAAAGNSAQQGFTLLEIMIALVLMMIVTLGAAALFEYAINYNSGANDRTLAHAIAQQRMEYLRRAAFVDVVTPTQPEPVIISGGRKYNIVTTVCDDAAAGCGGSATLKRISIDITPQGAGPNWVHGSVHIETLRAASTT